MPLWWFTASIRYIAPSALIIFCILNFLDLFKNGGVYGANNGYTFLTNIIGGWAVILISIFSGIFIKAIAKVLKKKDRFNEDKAIWR